MMARLGQMVDERIIAFPIQVFHGQGRACTVADEPLQPFAVVGLDTHAGVYQKKPPQSHPSMASTS